MSDRVSELSFFDSASTWFWKFTFASVFSAIIPVPHATAQGFHENTFLLDVSLGSNRSATARALSVGGYELSDGTPVDFSKWYSPRFPDLNFLFLTQLNPSIGLSWGFSLGERAEKYRIDPGIWAGFVYRRDIGRQGSLAFSAVTLLGGDFSERACVGDYGEIGGMQPVNCRLAASVLPPAETLQFLVNERGFRETRLSLRYEIRF